LTESGVYQEVAKLFQDEADLMSDFKSFLPDASLEFAGFQLEEPISQFNLADIGKNDNTDQFRNKISEGESVKYSIDYPAHLISGKKRTIEAVNNEKFPHKVMQ
jgi:histone deacetylase complex regulatory component SIN3